MQFCKMMRTRIKRTVHKLTCQVLEEHLHSTLDSRRSTGKSTAVNAVCSLFCGPSSLRTAQAVCKELSQRRMAWPGPRLQMKEQTELKRIYCGNPHPGSHEHKIHSEKTRSNGELIIMIFLVAFSVGKQNFGLVDHGFARSTIRYETCNKIGCEIIFSAGLVLAVTEPVEFSFGEWFSNEAQYPPVVL